MGEKVNSTDLHESAAYIARDDFRLSVEKPEPEGTGTLEKKQGEAEKKEDDEKYLM